LGTVLPTVINPSHLDVGNAFHTFFNFSEDMTCLSWSSTNECDKYFNQSSLPIWVP